MIELVQLESGNYQLSVDVTYENPGRRLWRRKWHASSRIGFSVDEQALTTWKAQLLDTLRVSARNALQDTIDAVKYPEFQPTDFIETEESF